MFEESEKRGAPRVPWNAETTGRVLPPLGVSEQVPADIKGVTENISTGGIGLRSEELLPANTIIRCEFQLAGNSMSIPTLLQVRWSDQVKRNGSYKLGLKFLL